MSVENYTVPEPNYISMNPEVKAKWLEALRSDKYEQGKEFLRTKDNKFCCLGVLIDIVDPSLWKETKIFNNGEAYNASDKEDINCAMPPESFQDSVDLDPCYAVALAMANDEGSTFAEIADMIEEDI